MTPQGYSPLLSSPGLAVVLAGLMELSLLPLLHASSHSSLSALSDTALHFDALGIPGRGVGGRDYPLLATVPETGFSCAARRSPGYYADTSTTASCQVFHVCQADGRHHAFLCPNGTIFSQRALVCDWWFNVQCFESLSHQDAITPLKSQRAPFKSQRLPQTPARVTRHPNVFPATPTPSHHQSSHPSSPTPSHSHSYRPPQQSHSHGSSQSKSTGHSQLNHSLPQHTVTSGSHNPSQFTVSQSVNSLPQFTVSLPSHSLPHFTSSQAGSHPHSLNQLSSHSQSQSPISQSTSHTLPQLKVTSSHSSSHSQSQSPVSQSTSHTLPQLKITSQPQSPVTQHLDIAPLFREDVSSLAGKTRLQEPHAKMRRGPLPFRTPGINQHIDQPILDPVSLGSNSQESNFISGLPPLREGERVEYDQIYSATIFPPNIPPLGDVYEAAKGRVVVRVVKESGENALSGVLQSVGSSRSLPLASFHKQGISKKPHASQIVTVSNGAIKGSSQGGTLTSHVIEKAHNALSLPQSSVQDSFRQHSTHGSHIPSIPQSSVHETPHAPHIPQTIPPTPFQNTLAPKQDNFKASSLSSKPNRPHTSPRSPNENPQSILSHGKASKTTIAPSPKDLNPHLIAKPQNPSQEHKEAVLHQIHVWRPSKEPFGTQEASNNNFPVPNDSLNLIKPNTQGRNASPVSSQPFQADSSQHKPQESFKVIHEIVIPSGRAYASPSDQNNSLNSHILHSGVRGSLGSEKFRNPSESFRVVLKR